MPALTGRYLLSQSLQYPHECLLDRRVSALHGVKEAHYRRIVGVKLVGEFARVQDLPCF